MAAYADSAGWILYLRDRASKGYQFSKLGKEGWAALAHPTQEAEDPNLRPALAAFYADYGLPEYQLRPPVTKRARVDFQRALRKKRVPRWVFNMVDLKEMQVEGGEEE